MKIVLAETPVHLGLGATATVLPPFLPPYHEWYSAYEERAAPDGREGRLVSVHSFSNDWAEWEMHPHGSELVYCVSGSLTLLQKAPGAAQKQVELMAGEAAINPPGVWHTAKVSEPVTVLFITAGEGTQHGFPPADELPVT